LPAFEADLIAQQRLNKVYVIKSLETDDEFSGIRLKAVYRKFLKGTGCRLQE
jgi:hypothetical protein